MADNQVYNRTEQIKEANMSTRFKPGVSGNPKGRPLNSVTTLLKNTDKETTHKIARKLTKLAEDGDLKAIDMFIDRTDGKVEQGAGVVIDNRIINILVSSEKGKEQLDKLKGGRLPELEVPDAIE